MYDIFTYVILQVSIAIIFNYTGLVIAMPCFLIIDYYRSHGKLMDVLCCIPVCWHKEEEEKKEDQESGQPGFIKSTTSWISQTNKKYNSLLTYFIVKYYSPFLQNYIVKVVAIAGFFMILGIGIWGCTRVKFDTHLTDYSDDERFLEFAEIEDQYFVTWIFRIVTKEINYPALQPQILEMDRRIRDINNVVAPTSGNRLWLRVMIEYFQIINDTVCDPVLNNIAIETLATLIISGINSTYAVNEPSCNPYDYPYSKECLCNYNLLTVEEFRGEEFTVIPRDRFYHYLTVWVSIVCVCWT